jgi:hypothetical protein
MDRDPRDKIGLCLFSERGLRDKKGVGLHETQSLLARNYGREGRERKGGIDIQGG